MRRLLERWLESRALDPHIRVEAISSLWDRLVARFPQVREAGEGRFLLPEKCAGFGDIEVAVRDDSSGYRLWLGHFTVAYFDFDSGALKQNAEREVAEQADQVVSFLVRVVQDELEFYNVGRWGGGYHPRGEPGLFARLFPRREPWLWSGPVRPASAPR